MQMSAEVELIAAALVAAQPSLCPAVKDKVNPAFKSRYADFGSIVEACRPALAENGLAFVQTFEDSEPGTLRLTTLLLHESGQWISGTCQMPFGKADPQGYGSAATYAKRYGLSAILGIVADDDDDGNAASAPRAAQQAQKAENGHGEPATPGMEPSGPSGDATWYGPGQCPRCHAPENKRHGKPCIA